MLVDDCQAFGRKAGKITTKCKLLSQTSWMLFSVETGSTWAEIQCALLGRRKAGEGAEELSVRVWTTLNAWSSEARIPWRERASCMGTRLICSPSPFYLSLAGCNLPADVQEIAQRDRIRRGNSCKWCSWAEEQEESWWPLGACAGSNHGGAGEAEHRSSTYSQISLIQLPTKQLVWVS